MANVPHDKESQDLGSALINDITRNNLRDISSDIAEITLDHFMNEGFLKEIPFIGTAIKLIGAGIRVKESIFLKKVYTLLKKIKDIPAEKRQEYIEKLESDPKYKHKVGEKLLMIIDQLDDMDKPSIIGKLFKAAISKSFDYETFLRLSSIVQRAFLPDLLRLKDVERIHKLKIIIKEQFATFGIMTTEINPAGKKLSKYDDSNDKIEKHDIPTIEYKFNKVGKMLLDFGL